MSASKKVYNTTKKSTNRKRDNKIMAYFPDRQRDFIKSIAMKERLSISGVLQKAVNLLEKHESH